MSPEIIQGESPVIHRPADSELLEKLQRKVEEYRGRVAEFGEYKHPEQVLVESLTSGSDRALDAMLKIKLLNEVLETGEVETWDFTLRMTEDPLFGAARTLNPALFADDLASTCAVIDAYCTGNNRGITGGTGLH